MGQDPTTKRNSKKLTIHRVDGLSLQQIPSSVRSWDLCMGHVQSYLFCYNQFPHAKQYVPRVPNDATFANVNRREHRLDYKDENNSVATGMNEVTLRLDSPRREVGTHPSCQCRP